MHDDLPAGLPEPDTMRAIAESACVFLEVLSNPYRLLLRRELSRGERCVGDIETRLDIRQPTLSQPLGVWRDHAPVRTRREGKNIHHSLDSPAAIAVMGVLYEQFRGPAAQETRDAR
ncbi:ArsR family transcriptional regulator [Burkholderia paludis]|uniref:ArsR/SmtB family transcription factor n=1 Tax=Burkholderia paludis TaxID=1506587 RepID=UPI0004DB71CB|nr:helix-turn-helix domain-containing protein [Burkholderia paludis]KFG99115.1 ArsR family transcriptional regulator [Burkholderia paludis]